MIQTASMTSRTPGGGRCKARTFYSTRKNVFINLRQKYMHAISKLSGTIV